MQKSAVISARIDPDLKQSTERIFDELGLTTAQAITLFLKQVELQQGLPFAVRIPTKATAKALAEARTRQQLKSFDTIDDLLDDLGIR